MDSYATAGIQSVRPARAGGVGELLHLDQPEPLIFHSRPHVGERIRLYGGEIAAQAVLAASRTAPPERSLNSFGVYFLLPGDSTVPVAYKVGVARDGGSFSTRTVEARQPDRLLLVATASFQRQERGLSHQVAPCPVPTPEALPPAEEALADDPATLAWICEVTDQLRVDVRFPDGALHPPGRGRHLPALRFWMRTRDTLTDSSEIHTAGLVYLSDVLMLTASLRLHPHRIADGNVWFATIGHSVVLHGPARADDWLLYEVDSDWTGAGRCLTRGRVFDRTGRLCASTTQEAVLRVSEAADIGHR